MLVARREPFEAGAHDASYADGARGVAARRPGLARTVGMLQILGSVLAIPVGLGSAYSIYRANFSPETACQSLRADIISMIDKRVDASTRRILAHRDVEKFEQTCGSIDPDATAAFKTLLAADKPPAAAPAKATPIVNAAVPASAVKAPEQPAKDVARKAEPRPQAQAAAKMPDSAWPGVERAHREQVSDTQWLEAVRQALVTHDASHATVEAKREPVELVNTPAPAEAAIQRPIAREAAVPVNAPPVVAPTAPAAAAAMPPAAVVTPPPLPPATAVAVPPAPPPPAPPVVKADDHPVPPDAIPDPADVAAAEANDHRSRIRRWIAKIPLMGNVIDNGLQQ